MSTKSLPNLDDARALLARGRKHYAEFNAVLFAQEGRTLWDLSESRDPRTGEFLGRLHMDRHLLIVVKPVIADSATNIVSALDHVVAALAKAKGCDRSRNIYFPWGFSDRAFNKALVKIEPLIGCDMVRALGAIRAMHPHEVGHVEAVKQISNSGKHWELAPAAGSAYGVAMRMPGGGQRIFQIPPDVFSANEIFEYYRGPERLPNVPSEILVGITIVGIDKDLPKSPTSIFECSFRFVDMVIAAAGAAI